MKFNYRFIFFSCSQNVFLWGSCKFKRPTFPYHNWAPSVMCFFLENSEVSQMQYKDVAAVAALLTHTHICPPIRGALRHTVSSGAIRADESHSSFWVCCSCCVVSGKPLWWLSFIFTSSDLLLLSFLILVPDWKGKLYKVSGWHRFRLEKCILIQLKDRSS